MERFAAREQKSMAEPSIGRNPGMKLPFSRVALILAALVALLAIGISVWKSRSGTVQAAAPGAPAAPVGDVATMIAQLEAKLKQDPNNARGWQMLGWSYFETGRYGDAAQAYARAAALEPTNATYWSALGEALVLSGPGGVSPQAEQAFRKAIAIDPKDHRARYFIGVKKDLAGDHKGAVEDWIAVLKDTPAGAPWEQPVRELLEKVATANKIDIAGRIPPPSAPPADDVATAAIPGPSREEMQAAASMPPSRQDQMVRGMVDGLAAKLKANPKNADGWIRLMRARMVLGEQAAAAQALQDARSAFGADSAQQARFTEAARTLGVPGA
jgi:cytochrome c-type biogenesis protein CcmH